VFENIGIVLAAIACFVYGFQWIALKKRKEYDNDKKIRLLASIGIVLIAIGSFLVIVYLLLLLER
jgi:drug/metabolite transporter (DMT)-like permease